MTDEFQRILRDVEEEAAAGGGTAAAGGVTAAGVLAFLFMLLSLGFLVWRITVVVNDKNTVAPLDANGSPCPSDPEAATEEFTVSGWSTLGEQAAFRDALKKARVRCATRAYLRVPRSPASGSGKSTRRWRTRLVAAAAAQALGGGDEVIRAGEGAGVERERVPDAAVGQADHALEHLPQRPLVRAESDEHRAVVGHRPVRHVPAKDLPEAILIGARHV